MEIFLANDSAINSYPPHCNAPHLSVRDHRCQVYPYFSQRGMDQRRHYDAGSEFTRAVATNYRRTSLLRARLRRRCAARRTIYSTPLNRRARPLEILP